VKIQLHKETGRHVLISVGTRSVKIYYKCRMHSLDTKLISPSWHCSETMKRDGVDGMGGGHLLSTVMFCSSDYC